MRRRLLKGALLLAATFAILATVVASQESPAITSCIEVEMQDEMHRCSYGTGSYPTYEAMQAAQQACRRQMAEQCRQRHPDSESSSGPPVHETAAYHDCVNARTGYNLAECRSGGNNYDPNGACQQAQRRVERECLASVSQQLRRPRDTVRTVERPTTQQPASRAPSASSGAARPLPQTGPQRHYMDPTQATQCIVPEFEGNNFYWRNNCSVKLFFSFAHDGHCQLRNGDYKCADSVGPHTRVSDLRPHGQFEWAACEWPYGPRRDGDRRFHCNYPPNGTTGPVQDGGRRAADQTARSGDRPPAGPLPGLNSDGTANLPREEPSLPSSDPCPGCRAVH